MAIERQEVAGIREDYLKDSFDEKQALANPIEQFNVWFEEAIRAEVNEPTAMTLATVDDQQRPHARIVLLKDIKPEGFSFFTNYGSAKGHQMGQNSFVSLLFFWSELQRQVRITGKIEKLPEQESDQYFQSRPRGSQIGAVASPQSQVIPDRAFLENRVKAVDEQFMDAEKITRPEYWGGYLVRPVAFEFWQGRASRLHDRVQYVSNEGNWIKERLAP